MRRKNVRLKFFFLKNRLVIFHFITQATDEYAVRNISHDLLCVLECHPSPFLEPRLGVEDPHSVDQVFLAEDVALAVAHGMEAHSAPGGR